MAIIGIRLAGAVLLLVTLGARGSPILSAAPGRAGRAVRCCWPVWGCG
ncbi:hypothetical protein O0544_15895 [Edwardsiella anguillarum]|nr:hypothetical protein [Edwardsiella anguillarum]